MRQSIFAEETRKWWTLAAVAFGLFMIMLDNTVVNVALPSIQRDLGADLSELQWIVAGYALTFAALMLIGGKAADAYGRTAHLRDRDRRLHPRVALVRARRLGQHADRRARRAGRGRRADEPRDALDHRGDVPTEAARHGDRDLGGRLRARARDRPARRRPAHRPPQLALDLLRQHSGRRARDRRELRLHRRVARRDPRASRPPGPGRRRRSACSR